MPNITDQDTETDALTAHNQRGTEAPNGAAGQAQAAWSGEAGQLPSVGPFLGRWLPGLIDFRRDLHQHPELSYQEFRTTDRIVAELESVGLAPVRLKGTGCYVDIGRGPIAVGLRADIDALPIQEATGLAFSSVNDGVAHSCGHDVHTTVMVGVAKVLADLDRSSSLAGRVRVLFQPAEEKLPGGALKVIEQGVLDGVPRMFALHCEPKVDVGHVGTRIGAITSASDTVRVHVSGMGGHTSRPHLTQDLVFAMAQIAVNVPAVMSRRVDVRSGVAVVWGEINAGIAPNAIPSRGTLAGTMRCLDADAWQRAGALLDEVVGQVASPYGVDVEVEHIRGVPPVVNGEEETTLLENAARDELGEDAVLLVEQSMGGEDFAWYLQEVPGSMMRLGTRTPGGRTYDLHQADYIADEEAIGCGIQVMTNTALRAVLLHTREVTR
ncbi:amidohydrolase [Kocuria sp. JC486]|uniref:amidohydrolase n=1 Tax=Kocuria sp. JC486 TaxID=1970736 RepID=UPI00141F4964|nr:amidohydrolase [Kocuria sp. JC486]NHU85292.1 amidohydrolase [Kocuria sp. JC486]